jgi:hypothetical protein
MSSSFLSILTEENSQLQWTSFWGDGQTIVKIVSNIAKKSLETYSAEESDFGFNTNKENFYQSYESLEQVLKYKLENTGKNPFLKFIVGYPNINIKIECNYLVESASL